MARGRFGHRPHASGNLTSLIASLYQQQRASEDRVMFDAYQNGGKGLDGKPVTDGKMLGYLKTRRAMFSKDDPLYAEWGNRITQLDFKIGEDKITLSYQQGHVGAGAVAAFYRHQLSTIPQDSEFYRTVAGRAAQWAKAAASAARGRARASLTKALEAKQQGVAKTWENFSQLEGVLTEAAKRAGLIAGNQTLTDADATDLEAFLAHGVAGPHGTTITFDDWRKASVDAYRAFDTQIGINKQLNRGTKELTAGKQKFLDQNLVRINTIDDRAKYEVARDTFEQAAKDAKGDPRAILDAAAAYAATLGTIKANAEKSGTGVNGVDAEFIGGLTNEITALTTGKSNGGSTVFDLQSTSTEATPSSDLNDTAAAIAQAQGDADALNKGTAFFGQDKFGSDLKVQYFPPGATLDPFGKNGLDSSYQPSVINLDGKPTQVMLKGQPVQALGLVDPQGQPVSTVDVNGHAVPVANLTAGQIAGLLQAGFARTSDSKTVGYVFADPNGKATKYAVVQTDGSLAYTSVNPFGENLQPGDNALSVYGGSTLTTNNTPTGQSVVPDTSTLQFNLGSSDYFLADESVTPKDLLTLAANSRNAVEAQALTAEADKRQKNAQAEAAYQSHRQQGPSAQSANSIGGIIGAALGNVTDLVRSVAPLPGDGSDYKVPGLKPLGAVAPPTFSQPATSAPGFSPSAPAVSAPSAPPPPKPVPTVVTPGKVKDDFTNVSPNSGAATGGTAVGTATSNLLDKLLHPPTGGGSNRSGGGNLQL